MQHIQLTSFCSSSNRNCILDQLTSIRKPELWYSTRCIVPEGQRIDRRFQSLAGQSVSRPYFHASLQRPYPHATVFSGYTDGLALAIDIGR